MGRLPEEEQIPTLDDGDDGKSESRLARNLILIIAAGFMIVGLLDLTAYWLKCRNNHEDLNVWHCLYLSIPLLIGVAILIKSSALAARVEEYLDE